MKKLLCAAVFAFSLAVSGVSAAPPDWDTFCPRGERFSISFPNTPVSLTKDVKTVAGDVHVTMYMDTAGLVTYQLGVIELPEDLQQMASEDPETLLKGFALSFAKVGKGKVVGQKEIKVGAYQGQEFEVSIFGGKGTIRLWAILAEDRIYTMMVMANSDEHVSAKAKAFFDSFDLKEPDLDK